MAGLVCLNNSIFYCHVCVFAICTDCTALAVLYADSSSVRLGIVKQESAEPLIDFVCLSALKWLAEPCRLDISDDEEGEEGGVEVL